MSNERTDKKNSSDNAKKLLDRITKRYEDVDQKLKELEKEIADLGFEGDEAADRPKKPR